MERALILTSLLSFVTLGQAAYPIYFHNFTGCLYGYIEEGHFQISFPDSEPQSGPLSVPLYDDTNSKCVAGDTPGKMVVKYELENTNYMDSMILTFDILQSPNHGYWKVTNAIVTVNSPTNPGLYPTLSYDLKPVDMYADSGYSYSCNSLVLKSYSQTKNMPRFTITLKRFQLQPFPELRDVIFAPSQNCSVWITLPLLMGAALVLFITIVALIGVYLLVDLGNQSSDLKFSKQGGMLMNQAQLDATKG